MGDVITSKLEAALGKWQARHNRRLSIEELEEKTGLSIFFLYRFKAGKIKRLDLDKLQILCDFFQVTPNDLIWEDNGDDVSV